MNLLDLAVVAALAVFALFGAYRGFVVSALKAASFFVSWIAAYILHPLLAWALSGGGMMRTLINYTEGAAKLNVVSPEQIYTPISQLSAETLSGLVGNSSLVAPFGKLVLKNITTQALASKGWQTVGDYFNYTVAYATLNLFCFLLLFFILRFVCGMVINAMDGTHSLPLLRHRDTLAGTLTGLLRGVLTCYLIMAMAPVVLSILNVPVMTSYVMSAPIAGFFYKSNFILPLISGKLLF